MTSPIIKSLEVPCNAATAFDIFVTRISQWWPLDGHAASAATGKAALALGIEPHVGGRVHETMHDGSTDVWGEVADYVPSERIAFRWHPGNNKNTPTRIDVVFEDAADDRARVTLTHSGWEVWGERAGDRRASYDKGWDFVLGQRFTAACDNAVSAADVSG